MTSLILKSLSTSAECIFEVSNAHHRIVLYTNQKAAIVCEFFDVLFTEPTLQSLADKVPVLAFSEKTTERFYNIVSGPKTPQKTVVLNRALVYYVTNAAGGKIKKRPDIDLQPGIMVKKLKMLFAFFMTQGIIYSLKCDFKFKGGCCFVGDDGVNTFDKT